MMGNGTGEKVLMEDRLVISGIILVSMVMGLVGNTLVVVAFILSRRLQTKTNIFVVNLAVADILTCASLPVVVMALLLDVNESMEDWLNKICSFNFSCTQIFIGTSFTTLAFIAVNRYALITQTKDTYKRFFRRRFIFIFLCISWLYPIVFVIVPLLFEIGKIGYNSGLHTCSIQEDSPFLYTAIVSSSLTLPTTMIFYSYGRIYLFLRNRNKQMQEERPVKRGRGKKKGEMLPKHPRAVGDSKVIHRSRRLSRKQVDITKSLFYTLLVFLICFLPFTIGQILNASDRVEIYTSMFLLFNSWVNPILYGLKHPHFRKVFGHILCRRWADIPGPSFKWMKSGLRPSTSVGFRNRESDSTSMTFPARRSRDFITSE